MQQNKELEDFELLETIQDGGSHGGGNQLFAYHVDGQKLVLKAFRERGSQLRQWIKSFSHLFIEKKRGSSRYHRQRTEALSLRLWAQHSFDVPALREYPFPHGFESASCLWLEYLSGPRLDELLENPQIGYAEKAGWVSRLALESAQRHRLAIDLNQPLLVQEHASVKHVVIQEKRMIIFDLEGGFSDNYNILEALCQEVSSVLRSLARKAEPEFEQLIEVFVDSYGEKDMLQKICNHALDSSGLYRSMKRGQDRKRRQKHSKTEMLERVRQLLGH